jgi:hypothetical protein
MIAKQISAITAIVIISIIVHAIFCVQVFMGLPNTMGIENGVIVFFPHYILMSILPPSYPIHDDGSVSYLGVCGKLIVTFPASVAYGIILWGILALFGKLKHLAIGNDSTKSG